MDNTLSSVLQGLNSYHQRTRIDKDSLLNGKIVVYSNTDPDADNALTNATGLLTNDYPDPNTYELLDVTFSGGDGSSCWVFVTVRVK